MNNFKIGILAPDYPDENKMPFAFIHARAKLYLEKGIPVYVFVVSNLNKDEIYEGVRIFRYNKNELRKKIEEIKPDVLAVHFPNLQLSPFAQSLNFPKVAWIHGHEIIWKPFIVKTSNTLVNIKKWILLIPFNIIQIYRTRRFLKHVEYVVFVSEWMKNTAEKHSFKKYENAVIIPNPIDTNVFSYDSILGKNRRHGVSLRSFSNSKYGLDIAIKAFSNQAKIKLDIVGKGTFINKYRMLVKKYSSSAEIIEKVIPHSKIAEFYKPYGFFVAPSRIEAQGVAMCEAMACGMPIISTTVGGIPEFVRDGVDGFLVPKNNSKELLAAIEKLVSLSDEKFEEMAKNARMNVLNTCSSMKITDMEMEVFRKAIVKFNKQFLGSDNE